MQAIVAQRLAGKLPKKARLVTEDPEDPRREDHDDISLSLTVIPLAPTRTCLSLQKTRLCLFLRAPNECLSLLLRVPNTHLCLLPRFANIQNTHLCLFPRVLNTRLCLFKLISIGSSSETGSYDGVGDMGDSGEDCDSMSASLSDESLTDRNLSESECATAEPKTFDSSVPLYPESSISDEDFNTVFELCSVS